MSTRAEQRRLRQLEIEDEQRLEDAEALKMTEEQRDILLRTFHSVKFEFRDLDGLSWTDPIRQQLKQPEGVENAVSPFQDQEQPQQPSFVVLTKAELAAFSPEETIRVSTVHGGSCFPQHEAEPPIYTDPFVTPVLRRGKRDGTRARSPIKGLFSTASDVSTDLSPDDHCSNRHVYDRSIIVEAVLSKTDEQATIRLRDSPVTAVTALDHLARDSRSHYPTSPTLCTSPCMQPPPRPTTTTMTTSPTGAAIITSIFRSPVFTVPKGRMRSQVQCSAVSTPKSSPSLASICSFSSP